MASGFEIIEWYVARMGIGSYLEQRVGADLIV
jgi:hypothetical protein